MKNAAVVLGLSSAFILALAAHRSVAGESGNTHDGYWECRNIPIEQTAYFSAIFEANAGLGEVAESYAQMLAAKYGYQGRANCGVAIIKSPATFAKAKDDQASYVKQLRQSQIKVFLTDWVYPGASAAAPTQAPASAPAAPQSPSMSFGYCVCTYAEYRYYSAAFSSPADQYTHWRQAFLKSLKERYNVQGYIQCVRYASQAESQKDFDNIILLARAGPPDRNVETGWVYAAATPVAAAPTAPPKPATTTATRPPTAPAPVAAPVPAPAPAAPKPAAAPAAVSTIHAVCWADADPATRYYSGVFSDAGSDYADWMPAFKTFLQDNYHYQRFVRCNKQLDKAAAQKYWNEMVANARAIPLPGGGHPKIIETGWTYP